MGPERAPRDDSGDPRGDSSDRRDDARDRRKGEAVAGRIAGVVLAAGQSRRMGKNKLLLDLNGKSVVRRAVEKAEAAGLSPVLVVTGHERERVEAELRGLSCQLVFNPDYASGMNSSVAAAISAVPDDCAGAVLLLADMPLVTAAMLEALCEARRESNAPLIVSVFGGVVAPPMLYGRGLFSELRQLAGDGCGKRVIKQHRAEAIELAWPAEALADLDVPADVERVLSHLEARDA
ncbi:MAG TPA: nucleotidyltransferase family protein [Myxococcales bacterium]|jgi:molybdenum cofactor cytidylyltransferase